MKKHLLASTALAAAVGALALSGAAVAQDKKMMKPSLTVSGYWEANVGVGDNDVDGQDGAGVQQDVEIHFKGKAPLDNGITISTVVELEGNGTGDKDALDETKVFVSGDFGQIPDRHPRRGRLRDDVRLSRQRFHRHRQPDAGIRCRATWVPSDLDDKIATHGGACEHQQRRRYPSPYYTPRFNGFQMGVSYSRSGEENKKPLHDTTGEMTDIVAARNELQPETRRRHGRRGFGFRYGG